MKKKQYEKPSMRTFELRQKPRLLQMSGSIDDYQDGGNPWNQ